MSKAILENITRLFDAQRAGDYDAAFLYALIAVDGTSKKLYSEITGNRSRYVKFLRTYYWVLEPMMGVGLNLKDTRFDNLSFDNRPKGSPPDFAEVVYEKHRCTRVHGDDVPFGLELIPGMPGDCSWEVGRDHLRMPTSIIWALTAAVVLCHTNHRIKSTGAMRLTLGQRTRTEVFMVADWWGREREFRPIAGRWNTLSVTFDGLAGLTKKPDDQPVAPEEVEQVIFDPPPPDAGPLPQGAEVILYPDQVGRAFNVSDDSTEGEGRSL